MKTRIFQSLYAALAVTAAFALAAQNVSAQDPTVPVAAQTAPVQLSYGVSQIVQLSKANISEGTIVSYVQNSGNSYGLDAGQIVYLKQQGVSDAVINTMLSQPRQLAPAVAQTAPNAVAQPTVSYVQTAPAYVPSSSVYVIPDTQTYNYYASGYAPAYYPYGYGCYAWPYPALSFSFGFGDGYRGGYYHGGWGGGYRGGFRGGGFHGGGWHR